MIYRLDTFLNNSTVQRFEQADKPLGTYFVIIVFVIGHIQIFLKKKKKKKKEEMNERL